MSVNKYKKALVIFIDILGSQDRNDFDELYTINNIFHNELNKNAKRDQEHTIYKRTIHTFSDCAYIIYDFKDNIPEEKKDLGKLFEVALCNTEPLFMKFLDNNFIFRGGIAYGDVYYEVERSLLFGSGINKAYQYENKISIYPRIAVEDFVATAILEHWNKVAEEMDNPKNDHEKMIYERFGNLKRQQGCIIKKDFDGIYMLHYLNSIETGVESMGGETKLNSDLINGCRSFCNEQIKKNITKPHIIQKYNWLLNYINSSCYDSDATFFGFSDIL